MNALEAVRIAPSAVNKQPWRIVKIGNDFHFYEKHTLGNRSGAEWDVQKIDMGIALYHFMAVTNGQFSLADPKIEIPKDTEYIATVILTL